jgi:hypothetical protein
MSTTVLKFSKIGQEDIEIGTGTFDVEMSDGRRLTMHRVNLSSFLASDSVDKSIYFTNGSQVGQDPLFLYDTSIPQLTIGAGGAVAIGEDITALREVHVSVNGAAGVRIENSGGTTADAIIEFALHGSVDWNIAADDSDNDNLKISAGATVSANPRITLFRDTNQVGINTAAVDTFATQGMVINQGAADDNIIAFQSSDVAHGITDFVTTDTYGCVRKVGLDSGGMLLIGLTEDTVGISLSGVATNAITTSLNNSVGAVLVQGSLKSGATYGALGSTANIVAVRNYTSAVFLIKGDGDVYNNGGSTAMVTFDDYDDVKLLTAVKGAMDVNYQKTLGEWINEHTEILERNGVITRDGERYWVSQRGFRGLLIDAFRQVDARLSRLESFRTGSAPYLAP